MKKLLYILLVCFCASPVFAQTWQEIYQKADSLMQKRDFKNSIPLYEQALPLAEKEFGKESENYLKTRNGLGRSMTFIGEKEKTEVFLIETLELGKKLGEQTVEYATSLHNIGTFYMPILSGNKPQKAEQYLRQSLLLRVKILGEEHKDYSNTLTNLGLLYWDMSNYTAAESIYLKVLQIRKKNLGEKHYDIASSLNNLANLYADMGNFTIAESLYLQALQIWKETLSEKNLYYAQFLNNLGLLYQEVKNYELSKQYYFQTLEIYKELFSEKHLSYAQSLSNLARLNEKIGNYFIADSLHNEVLQIRQKILIKEHSDIAISLNNLGSLYHNLNNFSQSEKFHIEALKVRKKVFEEKHSDYLKAFSYLSVLYQTQNRYKEAKIFYDKLIWGSKAQIVQNFSTLSENEKTQFYNHRIKEYFNNFGSFAIPQSTNGRGNYNTQLYDLQLFSKGILLNSVQKMKNRILNSKDSALIQEYESWNNLKLSLAKYYQMNKEEIQKTGVNLDSLENLANNIEKALSLKSESFARITDKKTPTWKDIQKKLKKNEAAIEIVRVNKFGIQKIVTDTTDFQYRDSLKEFPKYPFYGLTDTVYYAALIVKKKSKQPELVLLTNGNELENQAFKKYRNKAFFKLEDGESYQKYWQPIQEKLPKIQKVYFSPDGIYNQINLNILQNPQSQKYILDEIEIQQITNTKEILAFQKALPVGEALGGANFKASLFGRPAYDMDSVAYLANLELSKEINNSYALRDIRDLRKGNFSDLLGTEKEIQMIDSLLKTKNIKTEKNLLDQATEQKIKVLQNPNILHIATHGFFIADSTTKNPMLNSGILLAGVSNYYKSEEKPDTDDGVLTASEAQNLHLDNTDLVVLSACETGLGEIRNGEGVYGLQRAFKAAGAKSILMSHWKVDDQVTQELMSLFYKNWLQIGDKRKAFKITQSQIREKYKSPYYWGAFVLVGE